MPGTVDDFMRRFGGRGAIDDREAEQYYDRFASTHPEDREFDTATMSQGTTEYLGQLPDDQFEQAAHQAFLRGLAHLYNLVPYQRRAQHAGQCGVEVEGGKVPTRDWLLNLQILTSGGFR